MSTTTTTTRILRSRSIVPNVGAAPQAVTNPGNQNNANNGAAPAGNDGAQPVTATPTDPLEDGGTENENPTPAPPSVRRGREEFSTPLQGDGNSDRASSPLSPVPEEREIARHQSSRVMADQIRSYVGPDRYESRIPGDGETGEVLDELAELVANSHERYEAIQDAYEELRQEQMDTFNRIAEQSRAIRLERREFSVAVRAVQSRLDRLRPRDRNPLAPRQEWPNDDGLSYVDPDDPLERSRNDLFRDRDDDETTVTYERRVNAQNRFLARERYEAGARERERTAELSLLASQQLDEEGGPYSRGMLRERIERIRREREERDRQTPRQGAPPREPDGGPPSSHGSTSTPRSGTGSWVTSNRGSSIPHGQSPVPPNGGPGRGPPDGGPPGGGPPGGGPPGGDGGDEDGSESRDGTPGVRWGVPRGNVHPAQLARRSRSPSYLRADGNRPRMASMTPGAGHVAADAEHHSRQLDLLRAEIRAHVGSTPSDDAAVIKQIKGMTSPTKYAGDDNAPAFMIWTKSFLRWLEISRIAGPACDRVRVRLLGQHVDGAAQKWYDTTIDNVIGEGAHWNFEDSMCAMYTRFIKSSPARIASRKFYSAKYDPVSGVNGLYEYLVEHAREMPVPPDDYTFSRELIRALPAEIVEPMFRARDISDEFNTPYEIFTIALGQERSNRRMDEYQRDRRPRGAPASTPDASARKGGEYIDPGRDRFGSRTRPGNTNRAPDPRNDRRTNGPERAAKEGNLRAGSTREATPAGGSTPKPSPPSNRREPQCYVCREFGHISPNCPNATTPNLRTARVLEAGEDGEEGEETTSIAHGDDIADIIDCYESNGDSDALEGSQYEYDSNDDADAWFGAMRPVPDDESTEPYQDWRREIARDLSDPDIVRATEDAMERFERFGPLALLSPVSSQDYQRAMAARLGQPLAPPVETAEATDYSDMPDLAENPDDIGSPSESEGSVDLGVWDGDPDIALLEMIPSTDEVDDMLGAYVLNPVDPDVVERLFGLMTRMHAANQGLRQRWDEWDAARASIVALRAQIDWLRRELALAIIDHRDTLSALNEGLVRASTVLTERRTRTRDREMAIYDPLNPADRKSTRLNSSHSGESRMPSSA